MCNRKKMCKRIKYGCLKEALVTCDKCQNLICWPTCVFQIQISFKRGDRVMAKYWEDGLVSFSSILSLPRIKSIIHWMA